MYGGGALFAVRVRPTMKVLLEVDKGPAAGASFELERLAYRAVGRHGTRNVTLTMADSGERQLDPDDLALVEAHLARRNTSGSTPDFKLGSFRRAADILVPDDKVSRTHALFFLDDSGPSVVDLMSTNGTFLNGETIKDSDLADGDVVHVGKTRFIVRIG